MNIPVSTFDRIRKYKLAGLKINPSIANISSLDGVKLISDNEKRKKKLSIFGQGNAKTLNYLDS